MLPRGFSLLELVVVLSIVGALSAIAIPRFASAITHYRVESAAQRLVLDLEYARKHAMHTAMSQTVALNVAGDRYELVGVQHLDQSSKPYVVELSEAPYQARIVSAVFGGDAEVIFDIHGVPDSGGQVVVEVGSWQSTLTLDASTGEVTVN